MLPVARRDLSLHLLARNTLPADVYPYMDRNTYPNRNLQRAVADAKAANRDRDLKTRAAVARGDTNIQAAADCLRAAADEYELAAANSDGDVSAAYSATAAAIRRGIHELGAFLT